MKMKIFNKNYGPKSFLFALEYPTECVLGGMPKLNEANLSRIKGFHNDAGYIIISASRAMIYKDGTPVARKDMESVSEDELLSGSALASCNNKRTVELKKEIISNNFSFIPVYGGFKEVGTDAPSEYEKSFIVCNFDRKGTPADMDKLVSKGIEWGKEFDQDSILVKRPNETPKYIITNPEADNIGDIDFEFEGNYTLNDVTQMYFTALKKLSTEPDSPEFKGKAQRFTFEGVYLNPAPDSVQAATKRFLTNELCLPIHYKGEK